MTERPAFLVKGKNMGRSWNEAHCSPRALSPAKLGQGCQEMRSWGEGPYACWILGWGGVGGGLGPQGLRAVCLCVLANSARLTPTPLREELGFFSEQVLILTSPNPCDTPGTFIMTRSPQPEKAAFPWLSYPGGVTHPSRVTLGQHLWAAGGRPGASLGPSPSDVQEATAASLPPTFTPSHISLCPEGGTA